MAASTKHASQARDMGPPSMVGSPAPKGALLSDKYAVGEELGRGAFGQVQMAVLQLLALPTCWSMPGLGAHQRATAITRIII